MSHPEFYPTLPREALKICHPWQQPYISWGSLCYVSGRESGSSFLYIWFIHFYLFWEGHKISRTESTADIIVTMSLKEKKTKGGLIQVNNFKGCVLPKEWKSSLCKPWPFNLHPNTATQCLTCIVGFVKWSQGKQSVQCMTPAVLGPLIQIIKIATLKNVGEKKRNHRKKPQQRMDRHAMVDHICTVTLLRVYIERKRKTKKACQININRL